MVHTRLDSRGAWDLRTPSIVRAGRETTEFAKNRHVQASMLHIIIFDEMDAICKSRGSVKDGRETRAPDADKEEERRKQIGKILLEKTIPRFLGTGVSDSIVNQLLSKIDGVDSLNNILVIGMTNRSVDGELSSRERRAKSVGVFHSLY